MTDAPAQTVFYLDTSALVKRYAVERGSSWLARLCSQESGKTIATAPITQAEAAAHLRAKLETERCFQQTILEYCKTLRTTLRASM